MQSLKIWGAALLGALTLNACTKEQVPTNPTATQTGSFTIHLEHIFDQNPFAMGQSYTNGSGESVSFTTLRYYLSNVRLEKIDGTVWSEAESYHLVDGNELGSMQITLADVPAGEYHKLYYQIGVDSLRNVSGAQVGALNPNNDMFWNRNNGYIFIKVEGDAPAAADGKFTYHIGGFAGADNANIYKVHDLQNHILQIQPNASPQAHLMVDLMKLFDGMHTVSVANMNSVLMPGEMAVHLSHNFSGGISLDHLHD